MLTNKMRREVKCSLDEEKQVSLLLDDFFAEYRKAAVPVLSLEPQTVRIERRGFGRLYFPKKPVWVTAGLLASLFLVYFSLYRPSQVKRPGVVPESQKEVSLPKPEKLARNLYPAPSSSPNLTLGESNPGLEEGGVRVTRQDEVGSAGEGSFWAWFDRGVSLAGFPQEVRVLSQVPVPDWTDKSR